MLFDGYPIRSDSLEKYADLSEKKYPEKDYCFVEWLTRVKKLATIPPSAFYSGPNKKLGENYIRFCFIKVIFVLFTEHAVETIISWIIRRTRNFNKLKTFYKNGKGPIFQATLRLICFHNL